MASKLDRFGAGIMAAPPAAAGDSLAAPAAAAAAAAAASAGASPAGDAPVPPAPPAVVVSRLNFTYGVAAAFKPVLTDVNMTLPAGSRTLLVGDNGAGKSTLLRILAGRHLVSDAAGGAVTVLGRDTFHDTSLNHHR
jgi:ABC-type molybdenum transport system ATPase subunit/photorepair protein PhrA